jgi:copper transport protein
VNVRRTPAVALGLFALAASVVLAFAPAAWAHAQLLGTSPTSGSTVQALPKEVIFEFDQDVGGTFGAVRVYNSQGGEVDDLEVTHPDGNERWMGVGLKPGLPDGTYTATYRVISADTHIVYGGLVFDLGHASASSRVTVAGLIGRNESGRVTKVAFGVVRALDYLTLALMAGCLAFALLVWPPALTTAASDGGGGGSEDGGGNGDEPRLTEADSALRARLLRLLAFAVLVGAIVSVLGVLLQGASAAGLSLWSSLKRPIVQSTLESRFGWVWGVRALVWLALGALLALWHDRHRRGAGAAGTHSNTAAAGAVLTAGLVLGTVYLLITPALAGHASVQSPTWVFFPSDAIHVAAGSVWVGGIACLLFALPAATGRLAPPRRSRLLAATLAHFSPLALGAVVAIALTGVVQAYIDVRSLDGLLHTTYGTMILIKTALLLSLIGLGWANRRRVIPALDRAVARATAPGGVGRVARRNLRGELALMICVLGVTAALVGYAPPIDAATGPFSANTSIGPALLEMTVEPAKVGLNTIHLYLIDAKTGAQFTATKELMVTARLPAKGIGPLPLRPMVAGPGHYIVGSAVLSPGGTWGIEVIDRVSEFQQYTRVVRVPVR